MVPRSRGATAGRSGEETRKELSARPSGGEGVQGGRRAVSVVTGRWDVHRRGRGAPAHSGRADLPPASPWPRGSPLPDNVHRDCHTAPNPEPPPATLPAGAQGRGAADPWGRGSGLRIPKGPRHRSHRGAGPAWRPRPDPAIVPRPTPPPSGASAAPGSGEADTKGTRVTHLVPRGRGPPLLLAAGGAPSAAPRSAVQAGCPRRASAARAAPPGAALDSRPPSSRGAPPAGGEWAAAPSGTKTRGAEARPERSAPCRPPSAAQARRDCPLTRGHPDPTPPSGARGASSRGGQKTVPDTNTLRLKAQQAGDETVTPEHF
ncbi:collagen alpha-1(II) chain-like [Camelus ferus]|uniref:Collagen alpha-1(II) chain-like n=1 Tax=Camelus ferus TaxID=419612 RepID=A0A8B8UGZ0_CAMFR|nr:collagen alpha-1(II) chain-like [Camelus ferus]